MSAKMVTNQGDRLKAHFESIRDYISESMVIFRESGVEFVGQDKSKVIVYQYVLPAKNIKATQGKYVFDSKEPIEVTVWTKAIAAHLKCSSPRDDISFEINPAVPNRLIFSVKNEFKNSRADIVTIVPENESVDIDSVNSLKWLGAITMSSAMFHDMIRDLFSAEPEDSLVSLHCDGRNFVLSAKGLMSKVTFTVGDRKSTAEEDSSVVFDTEKGKWPVSETYPISFLQRAAKAKNVCSKISIYLRQDYPVALVYDSQIGTLTYIVAPRLSSDVGLMPPAPPGANKRPPNMNCDMRAIKKRRTTAGTVQDDAEEEEAEEIKKPKVESSDESSSSESEIELED